MVPLHAGPIMGHDDHSVMRDVVYALNTLYKHSAKTLHYDQPNWLALGYLYNTHVVLQSSNVQLSSPALTKYPYQSTPPF